MSERDDDPKSHDAVLDDDARAAASNPGSGSEDDHTVDDVTVGRDAASGSNELAATMDPDSGDDGLDFRERAKLLPDHDTWLERPSTVRGLIIGSLVVLALTIVAELIWVPHPKAHFEGVDGWISFHAVFGFVACVAMVIGSKWIVGAVLKRPDTYYTTDAPSLDPADHGAEGAPHSEEGSS